MNFRVSALPARPFVPLYGLSDSELEAHGARRVVADHAPGFPCRVSLREAAPGERVLLLNFEHLSVPTPYRSRYAIYVREGAEQALPAVNELPDILTRRVLSLRALSADGLLQGAELVQGAQLQEAIARWLTRDVVDYLHLHNAAPGCYAARVDRA